MELDQFNKGIIWRGGLWYHTTGLNAFLCYTPLELSFKTKLFTKAACNDEHQCDLSMPSKACKNVCGLSIMCTLVCYQVQLEQLSVDSL